MLIHVCINWKLQEFFSMLNKNSKQDSTTYIYKFSSSWIICCRWSTGGNDWPHAYDSEESVSFLSTDKWESTIFSLKMAGISRCPAWMLQGRNQTSPAAPDQTLIIWLNMNSAQVKHKGEAHAGIWQKQKWDMSSVDEQQWEQIIVISQQSVHNFIRHLILFVI